jgi:S1-C subfamily serine protease
LKLLDIDPIDDIALLQIDSDYSNLSPVQFANSDQLKLGEEVIAVGNVLGELQNSVTKGIISGLERNIIQGPTDTCTGRVVNTDGLIQTDAAINKGNSGGPLFNSAGQLVGMNTFGTTEAQNIGLAIPSNTILSSLKSYQSNGDIIRPRLGIYSQPITPIDTQTDSWLPLDYGEIIIAPPNLNAVDPGSAADKAGLKSGDIILSINGTKIEYSQKNPSPLRRILLTLQAGDDVTLEVLKATPAADGTFNYSKDMTEIKTKLGGIAFNDGKIISS